MTGDFHRSANLPHYGSPFRAVLYAYSLERQRSRWHLRADGFLRLMRQRSRCDIFTAAFCDGKESGGGRTLEPKAGDIDFHKLQSKRRCEITIISFSRSICRGGLAALIGVTGKPYPSCLSCHSHPIRPFRAPSPRGEGCDTRIPSSKKRRRSRHESPEP